MRKPAHKKQFGGATVEFAFILLVLVPLLLGVFGFGLNMLRSLTVVQLARDAGHMFARNPENVGQPGFRSILAKLGSDLGLTTDANTSNAVLILSAVTYIDKGMCSAAGKVDATGQPLGCTNYQQWVFTRRIVVGDTSMQTSAFGSPLQPPKNAVTIDPLTGQIGLNDQVTNTNDVATFSGVNPYKVLADGSVQGLPSGKEIFVSEAASEGLVVPPFVPNSIMYSFAMF
jgi:hypothetical protein